MKKIAGIFIALIIIAPVLYAQSSLDLFQKFYDEKNLEEAVKYASAAAMQNQKNVDLMVKIGIAFSELEKHDSALVYFKKAYELKDSDPQVAQHYARALANVKNYPEAVKVINQAIKRDKNNYRNYLTAAEIYIMADSLTQAELSINRAREIDPNNPESYIALGNFYFARRVYELSRQNYEEAILKDSNNIEAHAKLAESYYWLASRETDKDLSNELYTRSLKEWGKVSQLDSMNARAYFEQGKIWFFSERYSEAAQVLSRFLKLRPSGSLGRWYFAQSLFKVGECDSAIPNLEIVIKEIDSVQIQAKKMLAECNMIKRNFARASEVYQDLFNSGVELTTIDYQRWGQADFSKGDTLSALNHWKKAIDIDKEGNCYLMFLVSTLMTNMKDYTGSNQMLYQRLSIPSCNDSLNAKVYYIIGTNYIFSNQPDSAIIYLQKAVETDPKNYFAIVYLGDAYMQIKNQKLAMSKYLEVIEKGEQDSTVNRSAVFQAFARYCNVLLMDKNFAELNKYSRRWVDLMPDNSLANLFTAVSYQGLNDKDNACKYYNRVLRIDPGNKDARSNKEIIGCP
ncbi:MAG TPA: tetratricopeptide repeat protein [Candidatus Kapabacteria bacterium]|nr:tetratricopeptide repeat protein [Candidatus Kapabacteria bacterium]